MGEPPVIVIPPGAGEIIGDSADRRVEVLAGADPLHATWSRFGPGREGAGLHIHRHHTDFFYVLDGELTVRLGLEDEQVTLPPGSLAQVPPYVVHGFRNASDADVRYLNLHAPGCGFIDYMRGIRDGVREEFDQHDPPPSGIRPATEATVTTGDGVLADLDVLTVRRTTLGAGEAVAPCGWLYVLEGELEQHGETFAAGTWIANPSEGLTTGNNGGVVLALETP